MPHFHDLLDRLHDYYLTVIVILSVFGGGGWFITEEGRKLRHKFESSGQLAGKTKAEIVAAVGSPSFVSETSDGKTLCQWRKTGFHIELAFDADVCEGISQITGVSKT